MARVIRKINKLQPLQIDTVIMEPFSYIEGIINEPSNVVGKTLAGKITLTRNSNVQLPNGHYRISCVEADTFVIEDLVRGMKTANQQVANFTSAVAGLMSGIDIAIADMTGVAKGDYVEFEVIGDQTYIIPGTIVGKTETGNYVPFTEANKAKLSDPRVVLTFLETDKQKLHAENSLEINVSTNYAVDVVVYGQILEAPCRQINLTDELKTKLGYIAWV